jgi:hypothetical protein
VKTVFCYYCGCWPLTRLRNHSHKVHEPWAWSIQFTFLAYWEFPFHSAKSIYLSQIQQIKSIAVLMTQMLTWTDNRCLIDLTCDRFELCVWDLQWSIYQFDCRHRPVLIYGRAFRVHAQTLNLNTFVPPLARRIVPQRRVLRLTATPLVVGTQPLFSHLGYAFDSCIDSCIWVMHWVMFESVFDRWLMPLSMPLTVMHLTDAFECFWLMLHMTNCIWLMRWLMHLSAFDWSIVCIWLMHWMAWL